MWLERFLIIVPSLSHKPLSYSWGHYTPQWPEIVIFGGSVAAMVLLYTLFSKVIPIISIWELKAGEHTHAPAEDSVRATQAAGEMV
jgi:molybdopterin-containing oxidoreductase family membrane subunit